MGDSTFFHSGMTSLLEAVYNRSNVLLTILDNRITGMTGHQENPGTGYTLQGEKTKLVEMEPLVRALGVDQVRVVNPLKLDEVQEALKWGLSFDEPAVIITRWPCVLKRFSAEDKAEFGINKASNTVDEAVCIGCRMCVKTGCPALEFHPDKKKVSIDSSQCVACDVCAQVCPKKAIVRRTV
jgi:indolepyruvate ferredoxin oxidoreductase alpha subunit